MRPQVIRGVTPLGTSAYAEQLGILDYGTFEVAHDGRRIPIVGYVIVAGARVVLVDTGFPQVMNGS